MLTLDEIEKYVFEAGEREGIYEKVRDKHGNVVMRDGCVLWRLTEKKEPKEANN
jgi:hypothetical protein